MSKDLQNKKIVMFKSDICLIMQENMDVKKR